MTTAPPDPAALDAVATRLAAADAVAVLTGAGVSAESGIPTFRDALTGLWARFRPEELASEAGFRRDPARVQAWYRERLGRARAAEPNAGHAALARLERLVPALTLVTQNVDGLHQRAGSRNVVELHGRLEAARCFDCGRAADLGAGDVPVTCAACGGLVRPGVVWFGEALPEDALDAAFEAARRAGVLLAVGTSGVVHPAAALPGAAKAAGAFVAEVNPEPALAGRADAALAGTAGAVLPALVARVAAVLAEPPRADG